MHFIRQTHSTFSKPLCTNDLPPHFVFVKCGLRDSPHQNLFAPSDAVTHAFSFSRIERNPGRKSRREHFASWRPPRQTTSWMKRLTALVTGPRGDHFCSEQQTFRRTKMSDPRNLSRLKSKNFVRSSRTRARYAPKPLRLLLRSPRCLRLRAMRSRHFRLSSSDMFPRAVCFTPALDTSSHCSVCS